jgi:hypothetical protein
MGVDAEVYAKRARVKVDTDRLYNLQLWRMMEDYPEELQPTYDLMEQIHDEYRYEYMPATVLRTWAEACIACAPYCPNWQDKKWAGELVLRLIELYPDDEFRIIADSEGHSGEEPESAFEEIEP